jgi:AcrR family transcriptional regulator
MAKRNGEISRDRILTAAKRLFAANGYNGTTVSQIVQEAGLTQAAFYFYFKSKADILHDIFQTFEQQLEHFADAGKQLGRGSQSTIEQQLLETYTGLFELFGANHEITRIVFNEGDQSKVLRSKIVTRISDNMRENQALGFVRPGIDTDMFAEMLIASIVRIVERYGDEEGRFPPETLGRLLSEIVCCGVLQKKQGDYYGA